MSHLGIQNGNLELIIRDREREETKKIPLSHLKRENSQSVITIIFRMQNWSLFFDIINLKICPILAQLWAISASF